MARKAAAKAAKPRKPAPAKKTAPRLLAGGNPQIAKGYGEAPIKAYIAAIPGWKQAVVKRIDALVTKTVPGVKKAVKWNSPFYGMQEGVWFLSLHCYDKYVKLAFFRGTSLDPVPPVASKIAEVRYLHLHEGDAIDATPLAQWIRQARRLPGMKM